MGKTSVKEVNEAWKLAFQTPRNSRTFGRFSLVNVKVLGTKNQVFNDKTQNHFSQCTSVYPCPTYIARQRFQNPLSTPHFWYLPGLDKKQKNRHIFTRTDRTTQLVGRTVSRGWKSFSAIDLGDLCTNFNIK